jgi:hypothetical protein
MQIGTRAGRQTACARRSIRVCRGLSSDTAHASIVAQSLGKEPAVIVLSVLRETLRIESK